jgi:streptogramin lyase
MAKASRSAQRYAGVAFGAISLAAAAAFLMPSTSFSAEDQSLLTGRVTGTNGEPLADIPIKAHRDNSSVTVAVYTDAKGEYSFPSWSDLTPGSYSIAVELPDFDRVKKDAVTVGQGKAQKVDFTLKSHPLAYEDATASEIIAGLPGTDQQKVLFSQCSNCHTLQWALQVGRTKDQWAKVIRMMAGRAASQETPGTYSFGQKQFIEPLAEYLASIRGPGSTDKPVPFKQRPRPVDPESGKLVVTEYALPRGGERDIWMLRGAKPYVWPHDVIMNDQYAYYTDHFSYKLGRIDLKTGEGVEMPFPLPPGAGRQETGGDGRPGNPGGGAHELQFDAHGNVIVGMNNGMVKYDPKSGQFTAWQAGDAMFGLDPQANAWVLQNNGELTKIDTSSATLKRTIFPIPKNLGIYDIDTDSKGRTDLYIWREGKVGIFDPKAIDTPSAGYVEYKVPTPMAGPRRGQIDGENRLWAAEFYAGQVLMFDPDKKELKEYPLVTGSKPYTAPYAEPYSASADDKNQIVWTHDFSSHRLYRIDMNTGKSTEYMTPSNYEVRDLKVDTAAPRPTVWVPAYRPPSKLVKIQVRN